jgi:hypothetical protein
MSEVLEVDAEGWLHLPPALLGNVKPQTRYVVEVQGDTLILRPEAASPFWATATPEERAEAFRRWAAMERPPAPDLSLEAISRDSIYD